MKTKLDAVLFLLDESRRETGTRTRMLRTEKALRILELDPFERGHVMAQLDYWITADGQPFPQYEVSR